MLSNLWYVMPMLVLSSLNVFIITKVVARKYAFRLAEVLFILVASTLVALLTYPFRFTMWAHIATISAYIGGNLVFLKKVHGYTFRRAIVVISTSVLVISVADFIWGASLDFFWPHLLPRARFIVGPQYFLYDTTFMVPMFILSMALAILCVKATSRLRDIVHSHPRLQNMFAYLCSGLMVISLGVLTLLSLLDYVLFGVSAAAAAVLGVVAVVSVAFILWVEFSNARYSVKQAVEEQQNLLFYAESLEEQYVAIRKFRHDYLNILISINSFIKEENWSGLKTYYNDIVKTSHQIVAKDGDFVALLGKIKIVEIKSIIAVKLTLAQSMGIDISLEATEAIQEVHMNTVHLVRMLGIILDNAIEALEAMRLHKKGELLVALINHDNGLVVAVENTCQEDLPPLFELLKSGVSTKGEGRGLGLGLLLELASQHPNVAVRTNIEDGRFMQHIIINRV